MIYVVPDEEIGTVAEVIGVAFGASPDPLLEFALQDEPHVADLKRDIAHRLATRVPYGALVYASSPAIEAASIWFPPELPYPADSSGREEHSFENPETSIRLFTLLRSVGAAIEKLGTTPQWYLHLLASRPDCTRQGHSSKLLRYVLDLADAGAVPCSLVCPRHNIDLYRHFGFEIVAETSIIGCPHRVYSMRREAGAG